MNFIELIQQQAEQVFADKEKAAAWLNKPQTVSGGRTPLEISNTETGYVLIKDALERLNQGYIS
ncbi:MbcA/ParS/Xre antitoxin family protein [Pseudomonas corrugata]|uniref:MbcA/ParS/Xre antitoxin family protein n=1 Tax=Pseudomonas corrugata TaxID=47879 RepID=UPI00069D374A|nr:MbcA/ParS/Xre antitoxin family protein [Pseudomonas corrugata]